MEYQNSFDMTLKLNHPSSRNLKRKNNDGPTNWMDIFGVCLYFACVIACIFHKYLMRKTEYCLLGINKKRQPKQLTYLYKGLIRGHKIFEL